MNPVRGLVGLLVGCLVAFAGSVAPPVAVGGVPNDNLASAIAITTPVPSGLAASGNNTGATIEGGELTVHGPIPVGCQGNYYPGGVPTQVNSSQLDKSIWYKWTSPGTAGSIMLDTYGSGVDTALAVYTGATYPSQTLVACSDVHIVAHKSALVLNYAASTTYYIQLGVWPGSPEGAIKLNLTTGAVMAVTTMSNADVRDSVLSLTEAIKVASSTLSYGTLTLEEQRLIFGYVGGAGSDLIHFLPDFSTFNMAAPLASLTQGGDHISGIGPKGQGNGVYVIGAGTCLSLPSNGNQISGMVLYLCGTGVDVSGGSNLIGGIHDPIQGNQFTNNNSCCTTGILISGASNSVRGNVIGVVGTVDQGYTTGIDISGAGANNNLIGGPSAIDRNVISGNNLGIYLHGANSGNTIKGNYIGLGTDGLTDVGNAFDGIQAAGGTTNNTIDGNYISGNDFTGVSILGSGTNGNALTNNVIGYNGVFDPVPGSIGVQIWASASSNIVGGSLAGNTIGNQTTGVEIKDPSTLNNIVRGNAIVDNTYGVHLLSGAAGTVVGPLSAGVFPTERNVILRNTYGVYIAAGAYLNAVRGNWIGYVGGTATDGNVIGVVIDNGTLNTVGGNMAGEGNVISGNSSMGVEITGVSAQSNQIKGNLIGTDAGGTVDLGNPIGVFIAGGADQNHVGGATATERNVISGNVNGVAIYNPGTDLNVVRGNYIGTTASGLSPLGNTIGVLIDNSASSNIVGPAAAGSFPNERNVISGNANGVVIQSAGTEFNRVRGNYIGLGADGSTDVGQFNYGVMLQTGASNNTVGGFDAGEGNVISGNDSVGVALISDIQNAVLYNYIGTDATGTLARGNYDGVNVSGTAYNDIIEGNVISANNSGIYITGSGINPRSLIIQLNLIGTNAAGTGALGNNYGVFLLNGQDNVIGGTSMANGNVIAHSKIGDGIAVLNATTEARIGRNFIYGNAGLGIDLNADGVTPNDFGNPSDTDAGPNGLQNYPHMFLVTVAGGNTTPEGEIFSAPNTQFLIEFFYSYECDPSGFGEGRIPFGEAPPTMVTTDGSGAVSFIPTISGEIPSGSFVTATATDPLGNTSEFSNCVPAADDADDDNDGYTDVNEAGAPLCAGAANDDSFDDIYVNDGCPQVGPLPELPGPDCQDTIDEDADGALNDGCQVEGGYSEAQFKIGTMQWDPCGQNAWPADLVSTGISTNKVDIVDLGSFVAPFRRIGTAPNQLGFNSRWDVVPGQPLAGAWINLVDLGAFVSGAPGFPPMLGGARAFNATCPFGP